MNSSLPQPIALPTDPHSSASRSAARVQHLALHLTVDFGSHTLSGSATWQLAEPSAAEEIVFDTRDLTIEAVEVLEANGATTAANFTLDEAADRVLGQALRVELTPAVTAVRIHYRTAPTAAALQWLAPEQTAGTQPFLFTQSQAILARTWLPCQDSPGIRFTYEATVRVPAHLLALMSAENPQLSASGEYHFRMAQPIPAYLMALAVGDLAFAPLSHRTGIYAEPATLPVATHEFADLEKMVAAAEELYGPYRWERYDLLVLPPSFPFGGMENPRLTFVTPTILAGDRSLTSLVAHELAHSWSGNLVTNATWNDFWLNEGFTVYFERRIMEHLYGSEYADMLQVLGRAALHHTIDEIGVSSPDTHLHLALASRDPDEGLTEIAYEKGCALLLTLESLVGRPRLDAFIKEYFARFSFQAMDTATFLHYLRAELLDQEPGLEAKLNLAAWVDGPGLPPNAPAVSSRRFDAVDQTLAQLQSGAAPSALLPATTDWSSHEWVHFLHGLPSTLSAAQLGALDEAFHFTASGNAEILAAWFPHTLRAGHAAAEPALEKFLLHVGRRKFLVPLYRALLATPNGRTRARTIYAKARPNYHSVATGTIDALLSEQV
ncbi:M1 family metallopeptidase [Hymenobacter properus]|uniref:Aminopeptidase N n=1 Tax=Hymenobacter properus TaxID=2791026 RepID=A0A931BCZ8_9BACT|nr:M1 family metallopeptidase [Hymenobacter properus]MBF9140393.1 M1 family metallopeptidase [Hymenobacter properus]MBR7719200.1 M1 family metallopeptidase [Microvirga sp. SRT04]